VSLLPDVCSMCPVVVVAYINHSPSFDCHQQSDSFCDSLLYRFLDVVIRLNRSLCQCVFELLCELISKHIAISCVELVIR